MSECSSRRKKIWSKRKISRKKSNSKMWQELWPTAFKWNKFFRHSWHSNLFYFYFLTDRHRDKTIEITILKHNIYLHQEFPLQIFRHSTPNKWIYLEEQFKEILARILHDVEMCWISHLFGSNYAVLETNTEVAELGFVHIFPVAYFCMVDLRSWTSSSR